MPRSADMSARAVRPGLPLGWLRGSLAALLVSLAVIVLFFALATEHFWSLTNIANVFGQASILMCLAAGVAVVFISGEVDISVGSLVAAVAIPLIVAMNATGSLAVGIGAALLLGLVIGVINGLLAIYLRINSLIVTLGMLFIIRGLVYLYTGKRAIADTAWLDSFFALGNGRLWGVVPYAAIVALLLVGLLAFVMTQTRFGRQVYAVGGNPEVARLAGFDVRRIKFACFVISSLSATVGGILLASRLGSAVHVAGLNYEFQAVAAVVLGGVSLAGGIGGLFGAALGVLILAFVSNGLGMMDAPTEWQLVITGAVIIAALAFDAAKRQGG